MMFVALLVIAGLWLSVMNGWSFLKGYSMGSGKQIENVSTLETSIVKKKKKITKQETPYPERPKIGEEIGELYIPKLEAVLPIYHGTNEDELERGVGHFAGSVLPGEADNAVLSGHRDTVFRRLGEVGVDDELIVTTTAGKFTYKVRKTRIVDEDDRTVIVPKPRAILTVSTCYPFNYIGAAPERYILEAYLIESVDE
jgi:sortase A